MIKWIWTRRLSIKNSLSLGTPRARQEDAPPYKLFFEAEALYR